MCSYHQSLINIGGLAFHILKVIHVRRLHILKFSVRNIENTCFMTFQMWPIIINTVFNAKEWYVDKVLTTVLTVKRYCNNSNVIVTHSTWITIGSGSCPWDVRSNFQLHRSIYMYSLTYVYIYITNYQNVILHLCKQVDNLIRYAKFEFEKGSSDHSKK